MVKTELHIRTVYQEKNIAKNMLNAQYTHGRNMVIYVKALLITFGTYRCAETVIVSSIPEQHKPRE